jgi:hypothetical protein
MADTFVPISGSQSAALVLTETDRALIDQLRDGIVERGQIRAARVETRASSPADTKRARLDRNQEALEGLLEQAIASPAVRGVLVAAGHDIVDLRDAGARGTWARDVAPAITSIRPQAERETEEHRREAIREAARAISDIGAERRTDPEGRWIDTLEQRARTVPGGDASDKQTAVRLIEWAEEAMGAVSDPVAATARAALVQHAFEQELESGGARRPDRLRSAMRSVMEDDESGRYVRPEVERTGPSEANRITAADNAESVAARRQMDDFTSANQPGDAAAPAPGLVARLRDYFGRREPLQAGVPSGSGEQDDIPETLKRRYAVHVSEDRKTIELFEAGAKNAAITLDARSISTPHNEGAVIADVIALARDRGWQTLKVSGTAEFKDAVWLEASKAGLIAQHDPSSAIQAAYNKWDSERSANQVQQAVPTRAQIPAPRRSDELVQAFDAKGPDERLADPRLRNAQLELMIGIRTAEKELKRPIAEMPDVAKALTAAVRDQLASGRMFDAPFVKADQRKGVQRQVSNPKIEADRIPPPRV